MTYNTAHSLFAFPPREKDDLAPASSQDAEGQISDGNTQRTAEEPGPDMLPQPTNEGGRHDCEEGVSELEN